MDASGLPVPSDLRVGRLHGTAVPELLWRLCQLRATGVLHLGQGGTTKSISLRDGRVVFAGSSDPNDRLGEMLLRDGLITIDQLDEAVTQLGGGVRLGTILVQAGHLGPGQLVHGVLGQIRGIVLSVFPWSDGDYRFQEGPLPAEAITLGMSTGDLLLQGVSRIRSFERLRRGVGTPRARFRIAERPCPELEGVALGEGPSLILSRLGEGPRSVEVLCRELYLSNFEIYGALWALRLLGFVEEVAPDPAVSPDTATGTTDEGRLSMPDGLARLLVALCRSGTSGILTVTRGAHERTFHIESGRCTFATSNDLDDGLIAHLLRRGVISLHDREEVRRRLLSNRRVGTILLEMGVLDETDLHAMVREQLGELVLDTCGWDAGDWSFRPGEVPLEEIRLDLTMEALVAAGLRRVASWSRVREGCGGPDARLMLAPSYLGVLDAMTVSPDDWEVVGALRTPRTVREICRAASLGDFRVCQILWGLRVLGAVTPAPAEEPLAEPETVLATAPEPVPVSDVAAEAEVISDLWQLAAEKPSDEPPSAAPALEPELPASEPVAEADAPETAPAPCAEERVAVTQAAPVDPAVEEELVRFNARQRWLYRTVRAEVGAGAANFVRSCRGEILGCLDLAPDGSWQLEPLKQRLPDLGRDDVLGALADLLELQVRRLAVHVGPARAEALREHLRGI